MIFPSALNYPEECESLSAERFGSATDPGEPAGHPRPYDHNGFKNPWHLAHSRVPGSGNPAGRRYPDDRIGGQGRRAYTARSVLDAIIWAERHLASTHFDTRVSPPTRPVPEPVPAPGIPEKSRLCSTQLQKSLFQGQNQR